MVIAYYIKTKASKNFIKKTIWIYLWYKRNSASFYFKSYLNLLVLFILQTFDEGMSYLKEKCIKYCNKL